MGLALEIGQHLEQDHMGVGRQVPGSAPLVEAGGYRVLGGNVHARRGAGVSEVSAKVVEQVAAPRAFDLNGQRRGNTSATLVFGGGSLTHLRQWLGAQWAGLSSGRARQL